MDGFDALKLGFAAWRRPGVTWLRLKGRDASRWLQGQVTQDVRKVIDQDLETCLVSSTGQLTAHAHLVDDAEGVVLVTSRPEAFLDRVRDFVVMEDVGVERLEGVAWCLARRAPGTNAFPMFSEAGGLVLVQTLVPPGEFPRVGNTERELPVVEVSEVFVELLEVEHGIPRLGLETTEKTLPPELGAAFMSRTVSLAKGCYVGQEVLTRVHSRGHVNRSWVGLVSDDLLEPGATVQYESADVGRVHRSAFSPALGPVATATLRAPAAAEGTVVMVGEVEAMVRHFPLWRG